MTTFGNLFRRFFYQKSRAAYLIYLVQLAASLIITLLGFLTTDFNFNDDTIGNEHISGLATFFLSWLIIFAIFCFFAEPICILVTSFRNEKINRAQTWRLLPISDSGFYLANTLSSFGVFVYLALFQFVTAHLVFGLSYVSDGHVRTAFARVLSEAEAENLPDNFLLIILSTIILLILFSLLWYVIISFYHFAYRSIMDFLPWTNKMWLFLVRLFTLIIVVFSLNQILTSAFHLFTYWGLETGNALANLQIAIAEMAVLVLLFGGLNMWLLHNFVEAKQD